MERERDNGLMRCCVYCAEQVHLGGRSSRLADVCVRLLPPELSLLGTRAEDLGSSLGHGGKRNGGVPHHSGPHWSRRREGLEGRVRVPVANLLLRQSQGVEGGVRSQILSLSLPPSSSLSHAQSDRDSHDKLTYTHSHNTLTYTYTHSHNMSTHTQ